MTNEMQLEIDGMGIVFYSEGAIDRIQKGEDYFSREYARPEDVARHIRKGDMVGFCTGSGGKYILKFCSGYPDEAISKEFPDAIRLAINVIGGAICVLDLFSLMKWPGECPQNQKVNVEDGIYHLTASTKLPESGFWGDNQIIYIHLKKIDSMPQLTWNNVPYLGGY